MFYYVLMVHMYAALAYILFHTVRVVYMFVKSVDSFVSFRKQTRILEMILPSIFVLSGFYLAFTNSAALTLFFWIKMLMVFGSIPIAIIAFKRNLKLLALLSWLMLIMAYGLAEMSRKQYTSSKQKAAVTIDENATVDKKMEAGKLIYDAYCISCHGTDGKLGMAGAKDLAISTLSTAEKSAVIINGKNAMPAFGKNNKPLNKTQIEAVTLYIDSLAHGL